MPYTKIMQAMAGTPPATTGVTYVTPYPFPEKVITTRQCDEVDISDLISIISFAERTDYDPTSKGSGPFFVAHYNPGGHGDHEIPIKPDSGFHMISPSSTDENRGARRVGYTWTRGKRAYYEVAVNWPGRYMSTAVFWMFESDKVRMQGDTIIPIVRRPTNMPTVPLEHRRTLDDAIQYMVTNVVRFIESPLWTTATYFRGYVAEYERGTDERTQDFTRIPFMYGEHAFYTSKAHPWAGSPFYSPGHLHPGLFSSAYYRAQDKLPQILSNTFQNLLEAGQLVISLANGIDLNDLKSLKNLSGDAWLAYRYQYNTTVSDLEELESAIERFDNLSRAKGHITSYGQDSDETGVYHCALSIDPTQILSRSIMKRMNLRPTLANVWDMIPYSFIIDWFTNIGDVLAAIDKWLDAPSYGDVKCWYSYTNTYITEKGAVTCYFRFSGGKPLLPYWSMDLSSNSKTWAMRATDVVSLLI